MKLSILFCITLVARVRISNGNFVKEIKLFDVIDLDNAPGVSRTTGSIPNAPAYSFTDNTTDLAANQSISSLFARQAFSVNEFTVQAYVKTAIEFEGVLVSFGKDKSTSLAVGVRWLRGKSNTIVIEISYIDPSGQSFTDSKEMTVRGLEKNDWFFVSVRVHILEHLFRFAINRVVFDHSRIALGKFPVNGTLRLAQELLASNEGVPKILNRLNGDLQNVTIIFGPPSCDDVYAIPTASPTKSTLPVAPATCPTPKTVVNKCTDANGNEHDNGQEWKEGQCVKCSCKMGKTRCIQFCKMCTFEGEFRIEGSSWNDSTCEKSCECKDGNVLCSYPGVYERKRNGCPRTCADNQSDPCPHTTYDGCFCKGGKLMYNGKCIDRFECPCEHNGKEYANGAQELQGCQYCMCTSGEWKCDTVC